LRYVFFIFQRFSFFQLQAASFKGEAYWFELLCLSLAAIPLQLRHVFYLSRFSFLLLQAASFKGEECSFEVFCLSLEAIPLAAISLQLFL